MSLKTAVIGAGTVSEKHLSGLQKGPRTDLVAICDIDKEKAREKALSYGIKAYFDVEKLLSNEILDWVHICTPPQTHRDVATQVLKTGIPVLIEKPVTETLEDFEDIVRVSTENDVQFSVVHNHKFDIVMQKVRSAIDSGELGSIRGMDLIYTGSTSPDVPNRGSWNFDLLGGEFEEGLPHSLYIGLNAGGFPKSDDAVHAQTSLIGEYTMDFGYDGVQVQYISEDDSLCTIKNLSGTMPVRILYVHGEDQTFAADLVSQTLVRFDQDYKASAKARAWNNVDQTIDRFRDMVELLGMVVKDRRSGDWDTEKQLTPSFHQFDAEAEAIMTGEKPMVSIEEARWTVKLQEMIRESVTQSKQEITEQTEPQIGSEAPTD